MIPHISVQTLLSIFLSATLFTALIAIKVLLKYINNQEKEELKRLKLWAKGSISIPMPMVERIKQLEAKKQ